MKSSVFARHIYKPILVLTFSFLSNDDKQNKKYITGLLSCMSSVYTSGPDSIYIRWISDGDRLCKTYSLASDRVCNWKPLNIQSELIGCRYIGGRWNWYTWLLKRTILGDSEHDIACPCGVCRWNSYLRLYIWGLDSGYDSDLKCILKKKGSK